MSVGGADQVLRYKGFSVEIKGAGGSEVDSTWTSVTGGATATELVEATVGNDGERRFTPGSTYITDITMTGYLTTTRRTALIDWINATAAGKDARRDLTITAFDDNGKPVRRERYEDCHIVRVCVPRLSAGSAEPIEEVVVIKATRYASA